MFDKLNPIRIHWFEALAILVLLWAALFAYIDGVSFHPDESLEISMSVYFDFFLEFDLTLWEENFWTLTQPKLANYIIAIGRLVYGFEHGSLPCFYDFEVDFDTNLINGCVPETDLLLASRRPMAFLTGLSLLGLYSLISRAVGRVGGGIFLFFFMSQDHI